MNQRRYEAVRAFFVEGLTRAEAGRRFGCTRWAMVSLVREHRSGRLDLFAAAYRPGPPPGTAPAKDRVWGRVIVLRREALSTCEISARLASDHAPLDRSGVGEILTEEGFGRLRHPEPAASLGAATPGRDTRLPRAAKLDFASWPATVDTRHGRTAAGDPGPGRARPARPGDTGGHPGTRVVPDVSWLLSLPAFEPTRTGRVSRVEDLPIADPAGALFAGLSVLPKKSALTDHSYRTGREHRRQFLAALDEQMIAAGPAAGEDAIFDLDFHAVMQCPPAPNAPAPRRASSPGTPAPTTWKALSGTDPAMLIMDQSSPPTPCSFLTLRMRSPAPMRHIDALTARDLTTVALDRAG